MKANELGLRGALSHAKSRTTKQASNSSTDQGGGKGAGVGECLVIASGKKYRDQDKNVKRKSARA
jgi:hypothetical protein